MQGGIPNQNHDEEELRRCYWWNFRGGPGAHDCGGEPRGDHRLQRSDQVDGAMHELSGWKGAGSVTGVMHRHTQPARGNGGPAQGLRMYAADGQQDEGYQG